MYRTKDFVRWGENPSRLAKRLIRDQKLVELRHGLFYRPKQSRFGAVPPSAPELMRALLEGGPYLFTGPDQWNALGLGSTAVFADQLVYNTKRSGVFQFGNQRFVLRRVRFPRHPTPEWFTVDLIQNHEMVGVALDDLGGRLERAVAAGRLRAEQLHRAAEKFGTRRTRTVVDRAVEGARTA